MLDYKRIQGTVYTDTFHGVCKSLRGNLYSQVHATDYQYTRTHPMKKRSDVHETLEDFFRDVGVPSLMVSDEATELTDGQF